MPVGGLALPLSQALIILVALFAITGGGYLANRVDLRKLEDRLPVPIASSGLAVFVLLYFLLLPPFTSGFIYFHF